LALKFLSRLHKPKILIPLYILNVSFRARYYHRIKPIRLTCDQIPSHVESYNAT
jgi:hypothetical protein